MSKQKVCQVVENIGNGEGNAEAPKFPIVESLSLCPDGDAQTNAQNAIDRGDGGDPAVIALFLGQGQDEHQGEAHGGQCGDQRQEQIPPCLHFIGQLPVHEVHAIGAKGLEEYQQNEKGGQVQRIADGPQKQEHQRSDNRKADKRQAQNAGLVFVLLRSGKFHHGVGQSSLSLQGCRNGENADPDIVVGYVSIAAGSQKPGEQRCGDDGNPIEQTGGENIQKADAVPFFHEESPILCELQGWRRWSKESGDLSPGHDFFGPLPGRLRP